MIRINHNLTRKPIWMLSALFSLVMMGNVGCSLAGDQILPASLEVVSRPLRELPTITLLQHACTNNKLSNWMPTRTKYARQAEQITPIEDPGKRGFGEAR